jgi:uridine kinase
MGKRVPMPQKVIKELASIILESKREYPLRVGIDGIDAAGKTFLANEIASYLVENGIPIIRASIDGFHNPRHIRYQRGSYSPEGYYYDSFNYELLKSFLLDPLAPEGNRKIRLKAFEFKTDTETIAEELAATDGHILIFDGVFLFRREIQHYWDLKIFVDIDFQTSIQRALDRDLYLLGDKEEILKRYQERYIPGQKLYFELEKPQAKADIIVINNDYTNPMIMGY